MKWKEPFSTATYLEAAKAAERRAGRCLAAGKVAIGDTKKRRLLARAHASQKIAAHFYAKASRGNIWD